MNNKSNSSTGIGIGTIVFLIFLVLKLAKIGTVANWSWWWVTAPLWIPIAVVVIIGGIIFLASILFKR